MRFALIILNREVIQLPSEQNIVKSEKSQKDFFHFFVNLLVRRP